MDNIMPEAAGTHQLPIKPEEISELPSKNNNMESSNSLPVSMGDSIRLPSIPALKFLKTFSVVIEDTPGWDYKEILRTFSKNYPSFTFHNKVVNETNDAAGGQSQWAASVEILLKETKETYVIGTAKSPDREAAVKEASKMAIDEISKHCNIITRKTQVLSRLVYLTVGQGSNWAGEFHTEGGNFNAEGGPYGPSAYARWEEDKARRAQSKAFAKLTKILKKFYGKAPLDDVVFHEKINERCRMFVIRMVTKKQLNNLTLVKFQKDENHYLSLKKVIHPKELTKILMNEGGESGPYKLYNPTSLDLDLFWANPKNYLSADAEINTVEGDKPQFPTRLQRKKIRRRERKAANRLEEFNRLAEASAAKFPGQMQTDEGSPIIEVTPPLHGNMA